MVADYEDHEDYDRIQFQVMSVNKRVEEIGFDEVDDHDEYDCEEG